LFADHVESPAAHCRRRCFCGAVDVLRGGGWGDFPREAAPEHVLRMSGVPAEHAFDTELGERVARGFVRQTVFGVSLTVSKARHPG